MSRPEVVIVGGGLAGLTVAYRLRDHARVTIIEKASRSGGKLRSERHDGFLIEHGPDVFLARKPWARELCLELGLELQGTNAALPGSFIRWNGRMHPLPEGFSGLVPTRWGPLLSTSLLSPLGKARLFLEPLVPRRRHQSDETLGAFVRRRLGREAYERLVHPLLSGIYGGDIDRVSLRATFPQFHELETEFGSLIRGAMTSRAMTSRAMARRAQERETPRPTSSDESDRTPGPALGGRSDTVFATLKDGLGALPDALLAASRAEVRTGFRPTGISAEFGDWFVGSDDSLEGAGGVRSRGVRARAMVIATPAFETARLVRDRCPELAAQLDGIPYNSSILVTLGWDRSYPLAGYGYLNPPSQNRDVRACTWSSSKITGRAPESGTLVRLFFGRGPEDPWLHAGDRQLIERALEEVHETMGIDATPTLTRVHRWESGQPAYTMGHLDRVSEIDRLLDDEPGLFLTGAAYRGVGIPDVVRHANQIAQRVLAYL